MCLDGIKTNKNHPTGLLDTDILLSFALSVYETDSGTLLWRKVTICQLKLRIDAKSTLQSRLTGSKRTKTEHDMCKMFKVHQSVSRDAIQQGTHSNCIFKFPVFPCPAAIFSCANLHDL